MPMDETVTNAAPAPEDRVEPRRPLVVQQSFPDPRPTTNPYIVMLRDALAATPGVEVRTFSWSRALRGDYDVFHVHWPEILVTGSTRFKTLARQLLFVLLLLRLRLARIPWVRTQHNLELPSGISRRQRWLLLWADRWTTLRIALNDDTPVLPDTLAAVIPHGHYREWYADQVRAPRRPRTYGFVGLIRRYKNVDALLEAFARVPGDVSLRVAGKPSSRELADTLRALAAADPRVELSLTFLSDADRRRRHFLDAARPPLQPHAQLGKRAGQPLAGHAGAGARERRQCCARG